MTRTDVGLLVVGATLALLGGLLATTDSQGVLVTVVFLMAVAMQLLALKATGNLRGPTVLVPVVTFAVVGLAGFLFFPALKPGAAVSANLATTDATYLAAARTFLVAGAAFTAGAFVVLAGSRRAPAVTGEALRAIKVRPGLLAFAGWAVLGLLLYGKGGALLSAPTYLAADGPLVAVSAATSLTFPALLALAVAATRGSGGVKFSAWLGLMAWTVALFAIATRQMAVLPVLVLFARYLSTGRRPRAATVVTAAVVSVVLLQLALTLRTGAYTGHGLTPYWGRVTADPGMVWRLDVAAIFGNILFSVPLTGRIAESSTRLPDDYFWTSVSPLLGGMTDWPVVSRALRVNDFTPFSGLGELANYGLPTLAVYMLIAGAVFARLDLTARRTRGALGVMAGLLLAGFAVLFALSMLQYNLRSGTRIVYYAVAAIIVLRLVAGGSDRRVAGRAVRVEPHSVRRRPVGVNEPRR